MRKAGTADEDLKLDSARWRVVAAGLLLLTLAACSRPSEDASSAMVDSLAPHVASTVVSALDSCGQETRGETRWSGAVRSFAHFTLFVPDSARAVESSPGSSEISVAWPRCDGNCAFSLAVYSDSGKGIDARIAEMAAEQRRIDSVNRNPAAEAMEFDLLDAPPQAFTTPDGRGYLIHHSCGDCVATTLKFARAGQIADVNLSAEALPGAAQRMCEMTVVAKSFAWRRQSVRSP